MPTFIPLTCPACGGKLQVTPANDQGKCQYCNNEYLLGNTKSAENKTTQLGSILFHRQSEPREGAFSLQVPDGWLVEGGIFRVGGMQSVVSAQTIEAKLDFIVKSDPQGTVALRWCPEIKYTDPRMNPGAMMGGMFAGNYSGTMVMPILHPVEFLIKVVFPWAHPQATNVKVVHQQELPVLVENFCKRTAALGMPVIGSYVGGMVVFSYREGNINFLENTYSVIENMGPMAGGMWSNKDTFLERAPVTEFERWQPIMAHIRDSGHLNTNWLAQEMRNQGIMAGAFLDAQRQQQQREQQMLNLQQDLQSMDRQIADHRSLTNSETQKAEYLNLMNLEEYMNPYTREPETGSNQWKYRWVTEGGDEFYCDDPYQNPNTAGEQNRSDWEITPIRPRAD
ncbi:MAG: hypothetical protein HGA86_02065 [Anaerolineaceae bacterium]|nr:hypothetical protein [Anaerolineaceae bacterium]